MGGRDQRHLDEPAAGRSGRGRCRRRAVLVVGGLAVAVLAIPRARTWLKERMFGRESTFDYEG